MGGFREAAAEKLSKDADVPTEQQLREVSLYMVAWTIL